MKAPSRRGRPTTGPVRQPRLATLAEVARLMPEASEEEVRARISRGRVSGAELPAHVTPRHAAWLMCVDRSVIREHVREGRLEAGWCKGCKACPSAHMAVEAQSLVAHLERREVRARAERAVAQ